MLYAMLTLNVEFVNNFLLATTKDIALDRVPTPKIGYPRLPQPLKGGFSPWRELLSGLGGNF
jgi:hypothetical protein